MKVAKLNIEGYIGGADMLSLFGGEPTFNLHSLKKFLDGVESDVTDIHVYINSGGGSVVEGWAIYDKLKTCGKTVTTIGEGIVGSIATVIYMSGSVRKLHENSRFFIHNPYWMPDAPNAMEGEALINLGEDLIKEQKKILDFYAAQTGTDIESIEPLMKKATDLTSTEAVSMGFANEIISSSVNHYPYKLVAYVDKKKETKSTDNKMTKENTSWLARQLTKLAAKLNGVKLNMEMPVKDKDGNSATLFIESETEDLTGKPAFLVDAEGNQTVAPDGDYTDNDGKVIKVAGGLVAEIVEASTEEEKTDTAELEAKLTEATELAKSQATEIEALKADKIESEKRFEAFKTELDTLKNVVIGKGTEFQNSKQNFKKDDDKTVKVAGKNAGYLDEIASQFKK
jgi:ATP-dependent protease ClpP protease subunit